MHHYLARLGAGIRKPEAVNYIVQAAFQQDKQCIAGNPGQLFRQFKRLVELPLQRAVRVSGLLLFAQLDAAVGSAAAPPAC